jgi:DNA-directed RNA polymerase I, II, and III subunit RPABC2
MSDLEQSNTENMGVNQIESDDSSFLPPPPPPISSSSNNLDDNEGEQLDVSDDEDYTGLSEDDADDADDAVDAVDDDEDDDDDDDDDDEDDDNSMINSIDDEDDLTENKNISSSNKKRTTGKISGKSKNISELQTVTLNLPTNFEKGDSDYDSDDDEEEDDEYLQKFDNEMRENYILEQHPESISHNYDEIYQLASVQRNKENIIIDDLHKTIPILTKYEKTRILGLRAKQLNNGAKPMIKMDVPIIDGYLIALKELEEKSIPVIIRRPLPNGSSEYWHLKDLEIL